MNANNIPQFAGIAITTIGVIAALIKIVRSVVSIGEFIGTLEEWKKHTDIEISNMREDMASVRVAVERLVASSECRNRKTKAASSTR